MITMHAYYLAKTQHVYGIPTGNFEPLTWMLYAEYMKALPPGCPPGPYDGASRFIGTDDKGKPIDVLRVIVGGQCRDVPHV